MQVDLLSIFKDIVSCLNVKFQVLRSDMEELPDFDFGIRSTLLKDEKKENLFRVIYERSAPGVLYFVEDYFETKYCMIPLPKEEREEGDYILLGPYRDSLMEEMELNQLMETKTIPRDYLNELKEYYNAIPIIADMASWRDFCVSMVSRLCQNSTHVRSEYVIWNMSSADFKEGRCSDELSFRIIEERYRLEGLMLRAVSRGDIDEAMNAVSQHKQYKIGQRHEDLVRDSRNALIIANTLFRKAAEWGSVHPAHIDALSSQIAKRLETVNSKEESVRFFQEMIRKYCMLVQNYSLRGCSPVIQKVVNHINLNLTSDLSLKRLAQDYSVNASYLSTQFKKEMGTTLTEYTNQQRIRRAITLLNATNMQIQDIASESGIYDVTYFRKLFKKITGMTPTEYSRQVRNLR